MSSQNNINIPPSEDSKDDNQPSGVRKTTSTGPQELQPQKCPRCDSPNTKFCYYNNYSLSQPRHFCKTCRRYWTKGGALRNVPIGGGCRKSKKVKSASPRFSVDSRDSRSSSDQLGGLKFFTGFSPSIDFQLGGMSLPRLQPSIGGVYNQFSATLGDISTATSAPAITTVPSSCFSLDPSGSSVSLMGFNNPPFGHQSASASSGLADAIQDIGSMSVHTNIASSIESLSSMNQDLHWKLQQQRLAMLCGGERNSQKESIPSSSNPMESQTQKPQALFFQNLEISRQQACGVGDNARKQDSSMPTECFFGNSNSYAPMNQIPESNDGHNNTSTNNWNGVQAWGDLQQYSSLP